MESDEKARIGYQAAIQMINYEGQIIWRSSGVLISANVLLLAFAAAVEKFVARHEGIPVGASVIGILLCMSWYMVLRRQFAYYRYWFASARHLERRFLSPEIAICSLGKTYGEGGTLEPSEHVPTLERFPWAARLFRVEWLLTFVIFVFAGMYGSVIYLALTSVP